MHAVFKCNRIALELEYPIVLRVRCGFSFVEVWIKVLAFSKWSLRSPSPATSEFSYLTIFCKGHRYAKHGKMLNYEKFTLVNFTLLSDIDNRKPSSESDAAYVIHFLFLAGLSVDFNSGNQPFHFTKN